MLSNDMPLIVAHRGASWDFPDNTLSAIRAAWAQHADLLEIDVRLTRDGVVVLSHDDTLQHTAGRPEMVADLDWTTIRTLDVGSWKNPAFAGERVPTFAEALAAVPTGKRILVEIKTGEHIVPALQRDIENGLLAPESIIFICFDAAVLRRTKAVMPRIKVLHLAGGAWENKIRTDAELDALIMQAVDAKFDGLDLGDDWPLDAAQVSRIHAAGLECHVWTINDAARARQLAAAGVDGITTDRPGWLREQLEAFQAKV